MATYVRIRWLRTRTLRSTTSECTCPSPLVVPEGRIVCARACVRTRGVRVANGDARARMGERTTRVRIYVRTYVYTWGVRGREHARKKDTYVRTYVRTLEYVRTCVRTRQGGHARNKDTLEYVRTHGRSERGNRELRVARQRKALRTYVRTYVLTYVRT